MTSDVLRWTIIFGCLVNIGVSLALFDRVGRWFLPRLWMRGLFVANIGWMAATLLIVYHRIGDTVSARHLLLGVSALLEAVCFAGLWHWYGTAAGKAHVARMTDEARE